MRISAYCIWGFGHETTEDHDDGHNGSNHDEPPQPKKRKEVSTDEVMVINNKQPDLSSITITWVSFANLTLIEGDGTPGKPLLRERR